MIDISTLLGPKQPIPVVDEPCLESLSLDEEPEPAAPTLSPAQLALKATLEGRRFNYLEIVEPPKPTYTLNGKPFATPGNISGLSAWSKMGKSSITGGILACVLPGGAGDTFGMESSNLEGKALLHFDTEQSKYHHHKKMKLTMSRVGVFELPSWFKSYRMSGYKLDFKLLAETTEIAALEHNGIHSIILDGGIDFIGDPNNFEEAKDFIQQCMGLAQHYDTHILMTLHVNPSSMEGKTRGHFGSELDRKAETNLTITVDKKNDLKRTVYAKSARDTYIPESAGTPFAWDDDVGGFVTIHLTDGGKDTGGISDCGIMSHLKVARTKEEVIAWLTTDGDVSISTARRKVEKLLSDEYIKQSGGIKTRILKIADRGIELLKASGRWDELDAAELLAEQEAEEDEEDGVKD